MRYRFALFALVLLSPIQSFAQDGPADTCGTYDDNGNCLDGGGGDGGGSTECLSFDDSGNCAEPQSDGGDSSSSSGANSDGQGSGIVITENTPIIGGLAKRCFRLLSTQSSLIQHACEVAAEAAYQDCLDSNDGLDPLTDRNHDGNFHYECASAKNRALENCSIIPEMLDDLVTVCEDDSTTLQLYPF
ncbi:MAG: hypothetical protein U0136_21880 [Bdellovibrionota bacterium]